MSEFQVVCVCGGIGFPIGANGAPRIINVGRALQAAGIGFHVLHCGPTPTAVNTRRSGVYLSVPFEYTTCLARPENPILRTIVYIRAIAVLTLRLFRLRRARNRIAVYLWIMNGLLVLYVGGLCRLLGIPLVQEMNEWYPALRQSAFLRWLYRKPIFQMPTGILVISRQIEQRARQIAAAVHPGLVVHRLPSVVDSDRFISAAPLPRDVMETVPHFLWCGASYLDDVLFLVRALALVNRDGYRCNLLILTSAFLDWTPEMIRSYAIKRGLQGESIQFRVGLDDAALASYYKSAAAHLLPMWDDDKSRTRVPNKLAEYLASGRPVITCAVGELLDFLENGVNAYIGQPGNEREFADHMISVLKDPAKAARMGAAGQRTCIERMDYRLQIESLSDFFIRCIQAGEASKAYLRKTASL
jgi:glycosyltransferase involved in cell wall biosynthesis